MAVAEDEPGNALTLDLIRRFDAPRERVFRAFAEPEQLVKWWGPTGMQVVKHAIDVRVGGAWRTTMRAATGEEYTVSGVYLEISPPERLVFTWGWERDGERGHETQVTIRLEDEGDRTLLLFHQDIFESEEMRDSHQSGWNESLDCLEQALSEGQIR